MSSTNCRVARKDLGDLEREQAQSRSFFPHNELQKFFTEQKIREILSCPCTECACHSRMFKSRVDLESCISRIRGGSEPENRKHTFFSVFGLLVFVEHPQLILGFLEHRRCDYLLESWATDASYFSPGRLGEFMGSYKEHAVEFRRFSRDFNRYLPQFAVPRLERNTFLKYHEDVIMPFIEEVEIGKRQADDGHMTAEGANGKVYAFKILREYNGFPNTTSQTQFARKRIETQSPQAYFERSNIEHVQAYEHDHIVRLVKAYGHGDSINLIFPRAWTNLDHLLRNRQFRYHEKRGTKLELADAWKQMLGISKALKMIHGYGTSEHRIRSDELCIHFDLKPDNILIEREHGNWLITDFGHAALTKPQHGTTPRIANRFGTDAYAPPEIEEANMNAGRAYDIWSLGCIMLEVAAFMVWGYAGLKGMQDFKGLDEVRQAKPNWSRHSNHRFFYQQVPNGEYVVKHEIQTFMANLENSHARSDNCDEESKVFLKKITGLIKRMLRPQAKDRADITRVAQILSSARKRASTSAKEQKPHQLVIEPGEKVLEQSALSKIALLRWSAPNRDWEEGQLAILSREAGYMRLHFWAHGDIPNDINLARNQTKLLPSYAFWDPTKIRGSKVWIDLLMLTADDYSILPNAKFAFDGDSGLRDARFIQSVLTSQTVVDSFSLTAIKLHKTQSAKVFLNNLRSKATFRKAQVPVKDQRILEMSSATLQIWIERQDESRPSANRRQSQDSRVTATERPVRSPARVRRQVPPCRLCIYLHTARFICTVRMDLNWELRKGPTDCEIYLKPRTPASSSFFASWLRPTIEERRAGFSAAIPLDPRVLRFYEDCDTFEVDEIELTFLDAAMRADFESKYNKTKEEWNNQRMAVGDVSDVNTRPRRQPRFPDGMTSLPVPQQKAPLFEITTQEQHSQSMSNATTDRSRHDSTIDDRLDPICHCTTDLGTIGY